MAGVALALWALHMAINLIVRSVLQRRRIGRSGLIGVTGRLGLQEVLAATAEALAIGLGVAAPTLDLTGTLDPVEALDITGIRWAGAPVGLAAIAGVAASQHAMGGSWRIGVDQSTGTELVTGGPFRVVRHPIYTFFVLLLVGVALLVPNLAAIAAVVCGVLFVELQGRFVEEPWLLREHGNAYATYARRTGRFLPGIGRRAGRDRGSA